MERKIQDLSEPAEYMPYRIHCRCFAEGIYPWIQNNIFTPYWRFYWDPEPGGFLRFGDKTIALEPEHFTVISGYTRFSTFAEKTFSQFYIHFNPDERLNPPEREITTFPVSPGSLDKIRLFRLAAAAPGGAFECDLLAHAILGEELLRMPGFRLRFPEGPDFRIAKVLKYLADHLDRAPDNAELARAAGMNRNAFIRLFSSEMKEPPQLYCRRKRVERACELLHFSGLSIDEIAEITGFHDRYYFTRVFSTMLRIPPGGFRKLR